MKGLTLPLAILITALGIAGLVSHYASQAPDGLERVAEDLGFAEREGEAPPAAPVMPDYALPGHPDAFWSHAVAGVAGTLVVLGLSLGLGYLLRRRQPPGAD